MVVVEGIYQNGVVELLEPLSLENGHRVSVTVLEDPAANDLSQFVVDENDTLGKLIESCQMDTGISDLASRSKDLSDYVVDEDDRLGKFLEANAVDTGITDLASQHDHYIHGTPKRKE